MHRLIRVFVFLHLSFFLVSFFPHVTEESFILTKKAYSITVIIEDDQYTSNLCLRLVDYALDYIPSDWWKNVKSIRFSSKDRMSYFGVSGAVACFLRSKKEVVIFSNLKEISSDFFYETVIHEYAHAVDPDSTTWTSKQQWDLVSVMWRMGEFQILPIEITEKLKDEMCEYWAEIVEDGLQKPVVTQKKFPHRYTFLKNFLSVTASSFDPVKNHSRIVDAFNLHAELRLRSDCVWGLVRSVDKNYIHVRYRDKTIRLDKKEYEFPESFASYGLPMNLSKLSFIISGCRWMLISQTPQVGDTVLVFKNKLFLTTPYSSVRELEHRIKKCKACGKK